MSKFCRNNEFPPTNFNLQYNRLTTLLETGAVAIEASTIYEVHTYTIRIAVADAKDEYLDSTVFIQAQVECPEE